jgi:hypothetical protein
MATNQISISKEEIMLSPLGKAFVGYLLVIPLFLCAEQFDNYTVGNIVQTWLGTALFLVPVLLLASLSSYVDASGDIDMGKLLSDVKAHTIFGSFTLTLLSPLFTAALTLMLAQDLFLEKN